LPQLPYISLRELLEKDLAHGGKDCLITGKPDSGKTGLLLGIAFRICEFEICIFRGAKYGHELRFPGRIKTIAYNCNPLFYDENGIPIDEINKKIKYVETFDDILNSCELGKLNVLYFPFKNERKYWVAFGEFLIERFPGRYASNYISLFIDEVEDIIPAPEEGSAKDVRAFTNNLKEFRKTLISFYVNTQQASDIHWLAKGKIRYRIYLRGAFIPKSEHRVIQAAVDNLPIGRGIVAGSFFRILRVPKLRDEEIDSSATEVKGG